MIGYTFNEFLKENKIEDKQLFYSLFFAFFTVVILSIDSTFFKANYFDGRTVTNIITISYFLIIFNVSDTYLKKLMIVMIFLSYLGEVIFCKLLGMYNYRTENIPLYVPFGHSIVYASGLIYSQTNWAKRNETILSKVFFIFFMTLFLAVGIFFDDVFSLIFGGLFFWILRRKKWDNLYYFIAVCVLLIELVGTYFQCWTWISKTFNLIPTVNPPMGAVFFYAGGDVLLVKIVLHWKTKKLYSSAR